MYRLLSLNVMWIKAISKIIGDIFFLLFHTNEVFSSAKYITKINCRPLCLLIAGRDEIEELVLHLLNLSKRKN